MIKINFMYLIIQCKNISCNKFSFFKKKRKYFDDEKDRSMVALPSQTLHCAGHLSHDHLQYKHPHFTGSVIHS